MNYSDMSAETTPNIDSPIVFRCDYPEAAADDWAVFWEVDDNEKFFQANGNPDDPTLVADGGWIAVSQNAVISLEDIQ